MLTLPELKSPSPGCLRLWVRNTYTPWACAAWLGAGFGRAVQSRVFLMRDPAGQRFDAGAVRGCRGCTSCRIRAHTWRAKQHPNSFPITWPFSASPCVEGKHLQDLLLHTQSAGRRADKYCGRRIEIFYGYERDFMKRWGKMMISIHLPAIAEPPGALCSKSPTSAGHSCSEGR